MCFAIPSKIIELDNEQDIATIDTMGKIRHVSVHTILEPLALGDYILINNGFALNKMEKEAALSSLELYQEIVTKMEQGEI
ncbi:HypC/HybG/HupF family hydrogenase formation chaperone [Ferrimonas lipolytica]|uniref:HypC/HybG/HupF family hydrogenase formation chaperone n=1 Tax=Ferrimonas lipolytica TaxID=2724191 RepID=A0A6H1UBG5_9GAMM|nr:HypC/HybG/HupF family hydrogenase formation chaperone [Ferrimonas lipolytica]QIZ76427.1 HypC/HybG/HupF family hydrogenase formation chaperone [Ferrimonas lipolytica]